ncbi:MAG: helix-turn-helix domain-containing protein [Acidobacteriota bacterium]
MSTENGSATRLADEDPRTLLTAEEVAERLRVTKCWIYAEVRAGRLPHVRLGRYVRFRVAAIDSWIERIERGGAGEWGSTLRGRLPSDAGQGRRRKSGTGRAPDRVAR